ncbi:DDE superfamily endonuclease [Streptomyces sp. 3211.6]|uniref:IS701 family transposase n=1 Tax=Streptomyces sp. 3211.6 TaxID=1938845 RepID=UPI000F163DB7|nr:transposase [Streptomyces sp. 3211.6]RKT05508.1 DDE superfamily endonuclease [Streptomyces sp. 3211.6]
MGSSNTVTGTGRNTGASAGAGAGEGSGRPDPARQAADDLCAAVLSSLRRKDQREKGRRYVQGLLALPGRKSMRGIAGQVGGGAAEQSMHHFISSSTWDWQPIRANLSRFLEAASPLTAWVAQPMAIPKGGEHSVGVANRFDPHQGQMFRGQQAFGTWFASAALATPVGWEMFLPETETDPEQDPERGREPGRPKGYAAEPSGEHAARAAYEEAAAAAVISTVRRSGSPVRPVVLDIRQIGTRSTMNRFAEAGLPVIARISPSTPLLVTDPALPGHGAGARCARDVLQAVKGLSTPVEWTDPDPAAGPGRHRSTLAVAVRVMMPDPSPARRRHLLLVGEWTDPRRAPSQLWVTDLVRLPVGPLLRLTKQGRRVAFAAEHSGQEAGLRDFAGRALPGWHRHVTLASVAHAARALTATEGYGLSYGAA